MPLFQTLLPALLPLVPAAQDGEPALFPDPPAGPPPVLAVEGAEAADEASMRAYTERIPGTGAAFEMLPIPAGAFTMGSPPGERGRRADEGPRHQVRLSAFWMARCEVTWDAYQPFMLRLDQAARAEDGPVPQDPWADAVSRPTPPYVPMDFGMGIEGHPAICMTQFAARQYTKWLSMKTGRFYRLPTEAEWEYACRAGTDSAWSYGDDPGELDAHGWHFDNADDRTHPVGKKAPNPWGLHDMHGNVAEWVLDGYDPRAYGRFGEQAPTDPVLWPTTLYPRVVRGGSWDHDPQDLRSAARLQSKRGWKVQDPQLPKSIWYHTDAPFVGFRVVRPLVEPTPEEKARYWEAELEEIRVVERRQREGGR